jgi:hypothetical protein
MTKPDRKSLLHHMDETRAKLEGLLPQIDLRKEIYPGWTIRDLLAHVTGWDIATIDAIRAFLNGTPTFSSGIHDLDEYNALSISARTGLDDGQIISEWRLTRQELRSIVEQFPEASFDDPIPVPWGGKSTVTDLMKLFCDHVDYHSRDVITWLEHPENPLMEKGG